MTSKAGEESSLMSLLDPQCDTSLMRLMNKGCIGHGSREGSDGLRNDIHPLLICRNFVSQPSLFDHAVSS